MTKPGIWIAGLLLAGCSAGRTTPALHAPQVQVQAQALADSAYNIVWLQATVRNTGTKPVWLLNITDTLFAQCRPPGSLELAGQTPTSRRLFVCKACPPGAKPVTAVRYTRLAPGQQIGTAYQIDFNRVFPRTASGADTAACGAFLNRTTGAYSLQVVATLYSKSGQQVRVDSSRAVTVYRK